MAARLCNGSGFHRRAWTACSLRPSVLKGLLGHGDETPPELEEWALARIRQLVAHEVGHTIGLGHNYYNSGAGRISVMDYPHPLISLNEDGSLDYSKVYDVDIGDWDKVAITYGYLCLGSLAAGRDPTPQRADAAIRNIGWVYHHH